jgi:arsenate reductase-like glutaredoxin family protein
MEDQNEGCSNDEATCCGKCHQEEVNLKELGPEAEELAKMFDEVGANLESALRKRKQILEKIDERSSESPEMKEKMEKVLRSRDPVLIQFVLGL